MGNLNKIEVQLNKGPFFGEGHVRGFFRNISGEINFSPNAPTATTGKIALDARSLHFGYHKIDGDAKRGEWLNIDKFPKISYTLNNLQNIRWSHDIINADAQGTLSLKNRSVQISFPVIIKYARALRKKFDGKRGDLLFLKGEFQLSRGSLGINTGQMINVIKDNMQIKLSLVGCTKNSRPLLPSKLFQ
jgi:polyisoprenoid-binding protein YceI